MALFQMMAHQRYVLANLIVQLRRKKPAQRLCAQFARNAHNSLSKVSPSSWSPCDNARAHARHFSSITIANDEFQRYRHLSKDIIEELRAETERTRLCIDQRLRDEIAAEIQQAAQPIAEPVPERGPTGQYLYRSKDNLEEGRRTYLRQHVNGGNDQVVLNVSFHHVQLLAMSLSVDESFLAYLFTHVSSDMGTRVRLRHVDSGHDIELQTPGLTIGNVEWGPVQGDGTHSLFFTTLNELGRPDTVHACCVNRDLSVCSTQVVYHNDDEAVMVDVQRTKGCRYVAIHATTKTSNEIFLMGAADGTLQLVRPRQPGVQYHVEVGECDDIFVLANAMEADHESGLGEELSLFETRVTELPLIDSFGLPYPDAGDGFCIVDMDLFHDFVALYERCKVDGKQRIRVQYRNRVTRDPILIPLPDPNEVCASIATGGNMWYHAKNLWFRVESPSNQGATYSYDTENDVLHDITLPIKQTKNDGGECQYRQERFLVASRDGTHVPLSIIYATGSRPEPGTGVSRPTILIGYGAYGEPVAQGYDPTIIPLLDRGFVIAYAHTRGGGDLGRAWYRAGRLYNRNRGIEDYLACAEALVGDLGITDPTQLTAQAFSAGGVIVAAAVNQVPALFANLLLINAFLDVTNSMSSTILPLTEHEWEEWGNPLQDHLAAELIASYCPLANLLPQRYPIVLLVGTLDDSNVPYWHAVSFALKLRHCDSVANLNDISPRQKTDRRGCVNEGVLVHIEEHGGHHLHGRRLDVAAIGAAFIIANGRSSVN